MKIEDLLINLREIVDSAKTVPLMSGKLIVNADEIRELLEDIEDALPQDIRQAKAIAADRNKILTDAKKEQEIIIKNAEERKKALISQSEIVIESQAKANEIIRDAKAKSRDIEKAALARVEEFLKNTDEFMTGQSNEVKKLRQNFKASVNHNK